MFEHASDCRILLKHLQGVKSLETKQEIKNIFYIRIEAETNSQASEGLSASVSVSTNLSTLDEEGSHDTTHDSTKVELFSFPKSLIDLTL